MNQILQGDALEVLCGLDAESVDAMVTDPPAGISFMGKAWDGDKGGRDEWIVWLCTVMTQARRVLKPGAHALVWAIPRTSHWTAMALEDAGFEIRDVITHHFGSGFPKSLDVSKAIDAAAGVGRETVGTYQGATNIGRKSDGKRGYGNDGTATGGTDRTVRVTAPATPEAQQWDGWGTALKPATEHWILCRKPLGSTVAACVLEHGTGGLNVDGCRVEGDGGGTSCNNRDSQGDCQGHRNAGQSTNGETFHGPDTHPSGRWPPNLLLSHSQCCDAACTPCCPVRIIGEQSGVGQSGFMAAGTTRATRTGYKGHMPHETAADTIADSGTAARFFPTFRYEAKPSVAEREQGVEHTTGKVPTEVTGRKPGSKGQSNPRAGTTGSRTRKNHHPTVKPIALMQWLCRLVTPPGGTVLDPFCGSGSTGIAALREGFGFVGIELDPEYAEIARSRIVGDAPLFNRIGESS